VGAIVILFAVGTRRLMKGAGENAGKRLLNQSRISGNIVNPLIGIAQIARRQPQFTFADIAPQTLPLYCKKSRCRCHFE
jgi:hypothetical protein